MTHGRIDILNCYDRKKIILYTYHDGHVSEAIKMLMLLPFIIFKSSKDRMNWVNEKIALEDSGIKQEWDECPPALNGPWFYQVFGPQDEDNLKKFKSFEDISKIFKNYGGLNLSPIQFANWIVWLEFNKWMVVPDVSYVAWKEDHPDIAVKISDGYTIAIQSANLVENIWELVEKHRDELNSRIKNPECHIQVMGRNRTESPEIHVDLIGIIKDLLWQDYEAALQARKS